METTKIKAERILFSWNNFLEAFLFTSIYKAFCVGDQIVFVKIGNMFWFWLAACMCFCPVILPTMMLIARLSKARRTIEMGNLNALLSDPDNLSIIIKDMKPSLEKGLMGQECITVGVRKVYSHFMMDKNGLRKFIDTCWS